MGLIDEKSINKALNIRVNQPDIFTNTDSKAIVKDGT